MIFAWRHLFGPERAAARHPRFGTAAQVTAGAPLAGRANHLVAGVSFDGSDSHFAGVQEIGGFNPYTREFLGPGVIQDQPSEGVNPVRVDSVTHFYGLFATDVLSRCSAPRFEPGGALQSRANQPRG